MYKKLKKKLIFMYWITSTVILTGVIVTILISGVRQDRRDEMQELQRASESYASQIQQTSILNHTWIKQLEEQNCWYLRILEDDTDLMIPNTYPYDGNLDELFELLRGTMIENEPEFFCVVSQNSYRASDVIKIESDGKDDYYGRMYIVRKGSTTQTLFIVQKMETIAVRCLKYTRLLIICEIAGSLMLLGLSFVYVNSVVRPVEEANEKQKEFIAAVSHELRSPLAVLQVGVESMKQEMEKNEPDSKLKRYLYPMEGECLRMSRLIEDMLLLAATNQKNWTIREETVDIETLLIECYDAFCMMNQSVQDKIQIDLSEESLPEIQGDFERMKQIVMILLDNAMSYTNPADGIILRAYYAEGEVCIEVVDHGEGLTKEEKQKIFEKFYRREGSRSNKSHFGLGLSIAQRLVELHHGRIEVKDTKEHGTTFVIHLPIKK